MPIVPVFSACRTSDHADRIKKFMVKAGQEVPLKPTIPSDDIRILRAKLILEECLETIKGLGVDVSFPIILQSTGSRIEPSLLDYESDFSYNVTSPCNLTEVADGCADISVVTTGTLLACGIADEALLEMVDENNLAKFGPGHSIRHDGKLIKPPGHKPPDIKGLLDEQTRVFNYYENQ